jgi:hypothetical protein
MSQTDTATPWAATRPRFTRPRVCYPFDDLDDYLKTVQRCAGLGVCLINVAVMPVNPDPIGFVRRLGDEVVPKLVGIG